jgi:hypothetical protein
MHAQVFGGTSLAPPGDTYRTPALPFPVVSRQLGLTMAGSEDDRSSDWFGTGLYLRLRTIRETWSELNDADSSEVLILPGYEFFDKRQQSSLTITLIVV